MIFTVHLWFEFEDEKTPGDSSHGGLKDKLKLQVPELKNRPDPGRSGRLCTWFAETDGSDR